MKDEANTKNRSAEAIRADTRHEQIARRAFELWEQQGCPKGTAEADWFTAEQELHGRDSLLHPPKASSRGD